jgi:hypothetical protein
MNLKHTLLLLLATSFGCANPRCIEPDCALDPGEGDPPVDAGLVEARALIEDAGTLVSPRTLTRLQTAIDDREDHCEVVAIMAARWGYGSNDFDGFILSPNGNIRATTDGRFAPVRPRLGVFAGAITLGGPGTDPPSEPIEPEPDIRKTDAMVETAEDAPVLSSPVEPPDASPVTFSLGGTYRSNQTFSGTTHGPHGKLPVVGVWKPLDDEGGLAIGVFVKSSSDSMKPRDCITLDGGTAAAPSVGDITDEESTVQ